jgi:protein-serine/threonine kinase
MIQEKSDRLCSKRYKTKDLASSVHRDHVGRYVYPHDAEDIKAHRWFKDIPWDRLHMMTPPFVPAIKSMDDTHYFDEEDPISDFSSSQDGIQLEPPTEEEIDAALRCFNREIQIIARGYVAASYDTIRLRRIEREIDGFNMGEEQKEYLRGFVRAYGHKERKRPRDRLLRDKEISGKVLEVRKRGAFLGYSYRRVRKNGSLKVRVIPTGSKGKGTVWHRGRVSIC